MVDLCGRRLGGLCALDEMEEFALGACEVLVPVLNQ